MRKLLFVFTLLLTISVANNSLTAQSGYEIVDLDIGEIRLGETFEISLASNESVGGMAASFEVVSQTPGRVAVLRFVHDPTGLYTSSYDLIGAVVVNRKGQQPAQKVYYIYAYVIR
jgi:hypothetical protein